MAKISAIMRNKKRQHKVKNARNKRQALKETIRIGDPEAQEAAALKLQKCRRDDSPIRVRNRCRLCGRPHGVLRKFGLCRIHLRELVMRGLVPGLKKASW